MARLATAFALLAVSGAEAFNAHPAPFRASRLAATEDTDFDAPVLANPQSGASVLDHEIVVSDDECYLGKYGQYEDCVDFDPMHSEAQKEINAKAKAELPSFERLGVEITAAFEKFGRIFSDNN